MADVVELSELAAVVGRGEPLELSQRLTAEIRPVDEEEDPLGAGVLQQAITDVGSSKRLARAGGHLDQSPRPVVLERLLKIPDGLCLGRPQLPSVGVEPWQEHHSGTQAGLATLPLGMIRQPTRQRVRAVECEYSTTPGHRVQPAREAGLGAGLLVAERQRPVDFDSRQSLWVGGLVLTRLRLNPSQRHAGLLGLDDTDGLTVHVQHVVSRASRSRHFTNGDSLSRSHRCALVVLHHPAAGFELFVDVSPSQLFGRYVLVHSVP